MGEQPIYVTKNVAVINKLVRGGIGVIIILIFVYGYALYISKKIYESTAQIVQTGNQKYEELKRKRMEENLDIDLTPPSSL